MRIIFDGNNTALRCDHVSDLYNNRGQRTSAILGVLDTITTTSDALQDTMNQEIDDIIFVWDFGKSKRRKELWPEYKAQRHKDIENDLEAATRRQEQLEQMDYLHMVLPDFGVKSLRIKGEEADDLAYDLKCEFRKIDPHDELIYVSTDEDYLQMIDEHCSIWSPIKKTLITLDNFKEITGVNAENFVDYKVLKGDKSDNIPGVEGIGKTKGQNFINKYSSIENLTKCVSADKSLQKSTILSKFLNKDVQKTISIGQQMIDFKYIDYKDIEDELKAFINKDIHVSKDEIKKVIISNQFTSILVKMNSFMRIFNDLEKRKHKKI